MSKRNNTKNFWSDIGFIDEIRQIKRAKSYVDKQDYSDADITRIISKHPLFEEMKKQLMQQQEAKITAQIRIQMDRKRSR